MKSCRFGIFIKFSAKKKNKILRKTIQTDRVGQNQQLFSQTTMFLAFHQVLSKNVIPIMFQGFLLVSRKKVQKVWDFVKRRQNSSIWQKVATFLIGFTAFMKFSPKSVRLCEKPSKFIELAKTTNFSRKLPCMRFCEKRLILSIWRKLASFCANYHV